MQLLSPFVQMPSKHHADGMQKGLLHIKSIMDAFLETLVERMTQDRFLFSVE